MIPIFSAFTPLGISTSGSRSDGLNFRCIFLVLFTGYDMIRLIFIQCVYSIECYVCFCKWMLVCDLGFLLLQDMYSEIGRKMSWK